MDRTDESAPDPAVGDVAAATDTEDGPDGAEGDVGPLGLERSIVDALDEGVYFVDRARKIRFWNNAAERLTGFGAERMVGHFCYDNLLNHVDGAGRPLCRSACPLAQTMNDGEPRESDIFLRHHAGHRVGVRVRTSPVRDRDDRIIGAVEIFDDKSDLAAARREAYELRDLAMHDALTGLPNRRHYEMACASRIAELAGYGRRFGLLVIDIDHFKQVNDRHGHGVGDVALQTIARTILGASRGLDSVARYGGEEFVVLVTDVDEPRLAMIAERFRVLVERSRIRAGDLDFKVTVSVGGAMASPGETAAEVFARAHGSLNDAKTGGRNRVVCCGPATAS